jgi:ribose 5-phosphate isomerase A
MTGDGSEGFKRAAAESAVGLLRSGMSVGLGAGSTTRFALLRLAQGVASGRLRDVVAVPCSRKVAEEAGQLGIRLGTLDEHPSLDATIDGADEVDPRLDLIKGAGGALLHEKILHQASRRVLIIIDDSKRSPGLGTRSSLPVEVVTFGWAAQKSYLESLGAGVRLRLDEKGDPFRTEEGNLILDCRFKGIGDPRGLARALEGRAGIVEHGLFLNTATEVLVGSRDGVRRLSRADLGGGDG